VSDPTPELLSPAGNWDCARAAVAAGADAIYFGLPAFNARLRADNFGPDDLPALIDFLHRHGVRGFAAMNTLVFTGELQAAAEQLRRLEAAGVDAVIVQDLGLARIAREVAPSLELHASTQMTLTSPEGLAFVESLLPLHRAVLARELSIPEIKKFRAPDSGSGTPLEVFVHGALCVAYSGQCLTSESLGRRSANRGECAQACRMPYELVVDGETQPLDEVRYLLSPQDLAAVDLIPELVAAGVKSFKIEGRLKSPEYVAAVTRVYRKALNACSTSSPAPVTPDDRYALEMTFSRGLSTGWLEGTNHPYLTHGRFGKKRGPRLGTVTARGPGWVDIDPPPSAQQPPLKAGDGVVFDAGEDRNQEQGAAIWKLAGERLLFHRRHAGLDFNRIAPGQPLYKTSDPALDSEIRRFWRSARPAEHKTPLHLTLSGRPGSPLTLTARVDSVAGASRSSPSRERPAPTTTTTTSHIPLAPATRHPLTTATLEQQLGRLGDTPYQLASLDNRLEGDCHLPLSELNRLRRALVAALAEPPPATPAPPAPFRQLLPPKCGPNPEDRPPSLSVLCRTLEQLEAALEAGVERAYCDFEDPRRYRDAVAATRHHHPASTIHLATPRILKPGETGFLKLIERAEPDGLLLRNLGALEYYRNRSDLAKTGDFSLNVANPVSARLLREAAGLERLTISYDLDVNQVLDLLGAAPPQWFELTLHQHMPLFHMEHCVFCTFMSEGTTYKDCGRPCEEHVVHLRDRVGQLHRLQADVGCRNTLFNGRAQTGARFLAALREAGLARFRIELLDESASDAARTIDAYQRLLAGSLGPAELLAEIGAAEKLGVTEGTLGATP